MTHLAFTRANEIMKEIVKLRAEKKALIDHLADRDSGDLYISVVDDSGRKEKPGMHHIFFPLDSVDFADLMTSRIDARIEKLEKEFDML